MAHASTQRIYMRKGKAEQRVAKVGWKEKQSTSSSLLVAPAWVC
jgi:hypothetical protein